MVILVIMILVIVIVIVIVVLIVIVLIVILTEAYYFLHEVFSHDPSSHADANVLSIPFFPFYSVFNASFVECLQDSNMASFAAWDSLAFFMNVVECSLSLSGILR